MSIVMYNLYKKVIAAGLIPKGIKTDAILVDNSKEELEKHFTFNSHEIGGIKFESGKSCVDHRIGQHINESFDIVQPKVNNIVIKDEYDTNEFNEKFDQYNRIMIKGIFPGVGKTTSVINFQGHRLLFVTPFNKLAQQTRVKGHDAITLNMLLGFFGDGKDYVKFSQYDISKYDCICFDEILINPPDILHKIDVYMKKNSDKKLFATGDVDQLQPINFTPGNVTDVRAYMLNCLNQMFPNHITLTINKRLKTESQRKHLLQLKKDIFDPKKNPLDTLKRMGFPIITKMSEVTSMQNICYSNYRTRDVNKHVHNKLIEKPKHTVVIDNTHYWPGLELIYKSKKNKNNKKNKVNGIRQYTNYSYIITSINKKQFTIREPVEGTSVTLPIDMLDSFKLPYANTCHSVQGLSINGPIKIFDINTPFVDRFFVWTALTRSTDFSNITIFEHPASEIESLKSCKIKQYFKNKVDGYKHQDKTADRKWNSIDYVDVE